MNDLIALAEELDKFADDKILYVKTEPEITDFTRTFSGKMVIYGQKQTLTVGFPDKICTDNFFYQLKNTAFTAEKTVIFWNVKNLISYFKFHLPRTKVELDCKILDLRLVESFLGTKLAPPISLNESLRRLSPYIKNEDCKKIHEEIHKPLSLRVIPSMETTSVIIDTSISKYVYPSYEIEGQTFGRLACHKEFDNCITPHNAGDAQKSVLKLKGEKDFFVLFDFRHMEASMLRWLSGDQELKSALENHTDLYKGIYQNIFGQPCDADSKRDFVKAIFLPIMFGLQPTGLVNDMAEKGIEISLGMAQQIHQLIRTKYKTAWEFLSDTQEKAKNTPIIKDKFGRPRSFVEKPWGVRGFLVQSSSAIFCQEKLIELYNAINNIGNLIYSIHDGYLLVANQENLNKVVVTGLKTLQSESKLCPGLSLKASCSIGVMWNCMKEVPIKERNGNG